MWKQAFKTTLIAGTLDISAACIQAYSMNKVEPTTVLKYIASGFLGKEAFGGGLLVMAIGLLAHYFIAFSCVAIFFFFYPTLKALHHKVILNSVLIGVIAWTVTTRIIIPLSKIKPAPFSIEKAMLAILILVACIGLPTALGARKYQTVREKLSKN
jgi:hypothetical protein